MSRKVSMTAMFISFAVILSYIEHLIPPIGIPGIKLGLANLAIILVLYLEGVRAAGISNLIRILIIGFMFGNVFSILFSLVGAFVSLLGMYLLKKCNRFSMITVSIFGGVLHNFAQVITASFLMKTRYVWAYMPVLMIAGVMMGAVIGILSSTILNRMEDTYRKWK